MTRLEAKGAVYIAKWMHLHPEATNAEAETEYNEAMLRIYVYGDPAPRTDCHLVQDVVEGRAVHKTYPTIFAKSLISHIITCANCYEFNNEKAEEPR